VRKVWLAEEQQKEFARKEEERRKELERDAQYYEQEYVGCILESVIYCSKRVSVTW